jgi:hypothetical protein
VHTEDKGQSSGQLGMPPRLLEGGMKGISELLERREREAGEGQGDNGVPASRIWS